MDFNAILQSITTVGFPIVMCGAMAFYVKYTTDNNRKEVSALNAQHTLEIKEITKAIENNTIALTKLCENMEG